MEMSGRFTGCHDAGMETAQRDDPAAALTERIGRAITNAALVLFPAGALVCALILVVGDPEQPGRVLWTGLMSLLGSVAAIHSWWRKRPSSTSS